MGQITITHRKMAQELISQAYLLREKTFDSWLEMGGNKYFGTSANLKDLNFWFYKKTVQHPPPPMLVYRGLWHNCIKILNAFI